MVLIDFLARMKQMTTMQEHVICFSGREYPLLFFYYLFLFFKKSGHPVETINCGITDTVTIKNMFSTLSFSGRMTYWLADFYQLSEKKQEELVTYLSGYQGPHSILFFCNKNLVSKLSQQSLITLPDTITLHDFTAVRSLLHDNSQNKTDFTSQIVPYMDLLSLDSLCLLVHYELVLSKNSDDFFSQWITRIIDSKNSLFVLSQYFFAKKEKQFFRQWANLSEQYAPVFWPTYWADQCWRAYIYCELMQQKNYIEAKKAQYKLPFSFINRDWSLYKLDELRSMHHFLYEIDFKLKNGGSDIGLEYFYTEFFDGKFRGN